eukprot:TRINITY_DN18856_c0_g1_i3.p1 TRINITY_DN18856_c0_g1~~TRINITY_DN18856_c0_g1_i3.p1  ORF type:complete len:110 (+),score=10.98 TRINITY_DN18856_c0_g1_i3:109-438(+)
MKGRQPAKAITLPSASQFGNVASFYSKGKEEKATPQTVDEKVKAMISSKSATPSTPSLDRSTSSNASVASLVLKERSLDDYEWACFQVFLARQAKAEQQNCASNTKLSL